MLSFNSRGGVINIQFFFTGAVFLQDFGWVIAKEKTSGTTYSKTSELSPFSVYCFSLMQIK